MAVRDDKGRFIKGHSGNPSGRPIDQFKYQKKIDTATSLKDWRAIIDKAIDQAKRGDSKARAWLSEYLAGKPIQGIDLTTGGEQLTDSKQYDRAISTLADALRESIFSEGTEQNGDMDTAEQATMDGAAIES